MIEILGVYYDGKVSAPRKVRVRFVGDGIVSIESESLKLEYPLAEVRISPRVGNTCRSLYLPGGGKCESFENDAIDQAIALSDQGALPAFLHRLESGWHYVLFAVFAVIVTVWVSIEYGVPALARWAAFAMPPTVAKSLGESGLISLDELLLKPSSLPDATRSRIDGRFRAMTAGSTGDYRYRLEFRRGAALGANALALPGGIILVTDELIGLADNDEEVMAVLAHELGHVEHRHGLRTLFQDSFSALLLAGLLGDVTSISALSATLPTVLVQARYSREFEKKADSYALEFLKKQNIAVEHFAALLRRLSRKGTEGGDDFEYLSSHPATEKRIRAILDRRE